MTIRDSPVNRQTLIIIFLLCELGICLFDSTLSLDSTNNKIPERVMRRISRQVMIPPQRLWALSAWFTGDALTGLILDVFLLLPSRAASWMANFEGSSMVGYVRLDFELNRGKGGMVVRSQEVELNSSCQGGLIWMPEWQDTWIPESERSLNVTEVDLS